MYAVVPRMMPSRVIAGLVIVGDCEAGPSPRPSPPSGEREAEGRVRGSNAFAKPKSSTLTPYMQKPL
jgi:hypothetical protein